MKRSEFFGNCFRNRLTTLFMSRVFTKRSRFDSRDFFLCLMGASVEIRNNWSSLSNFSRFRGFVFKRFMAETPLSGSKKVDGCGIKVAERNRENVSCCSRTTPVKKKRGKNVGLYFSTRILLASQERGSFCQKTFRFEFTNPLSSTLRIPMRNLKV